MTCGSDGSGVGVDLRFRGLFGLVAVVVCVAGAPIEAVADRKEFRGNGRCGGVLDEIIFNTGDESEVVVTLDDIVPPDLQGLIRTDRKSLTGVWIGDIDLWTNANERACEIPTRADCPAGALEGACPEIPPAEPLFSCGSPSTWANNTFSIYELTTGSLYALNLWRVWSQQEYPSVASLRAARPAPVYRGISFENGLRNLDDRVSMRTSLGEVDILGNGAGTEVVLKNLISMEGRVYQSNVGTVIINEAQTDTAVSLVYAPTGPKQALWRVNLRRVRGCVTPSSFETKVFPPRRKIRIDAKD